MYLHKTFVVELDGRCLVYIPSLFKIYEIDPKIKESIPATLESETPLPVGRWDYAKPYKFNGANFLLTNGCNLCCAYCYECAGEAAPVTIMPEKIAAAAIDYLIESAAELNISGIHLNMFGGEPTVAPKTLRFATGYARKLASENNLHCRIAITTNGAMPADQTDWLCDNMDSIMISMDGPKDIQDLQRSKSFDRVYLNAAKIYEKIGKKLSFRVTVSEATVNRLPEIVDFFGHSFPGVKIAVEPLFKIGRGKNEHCSSPDSQAFFNRFLESLPIVQAHGCQLKTSVLNLGAKTSQFCGVAGTNFMIGPDGTVTTCNRMIFSDEPAREKFIFGRFNDATGQFDFDESKHHWLSRLSTDSIATCSDCFAQSNCRGDCVANKAVLDPENFWLNRSYRCEEIKKFIARVLFYVADNSDAVIG